MSVAAPRLSIEDFHRFYDGVKPHREYWFGEATSKTVPTSLHGAVQFVLMLLLRAYGWNALPEIALKLSPDAEPIPDVIASRKKIEQPYPTKDFELCIEISAPGDLLKKLFEKGDYYLRRGVQNVWIVDPEARTAWAMTSERPEPIWIHPDGSLTADDETVIPLPQLFAEVDKILS